MNEDEKPQGTSQPEPQAQPEPTPTKPNASMPNKDAGWAGASPTQVMRTVAVALLTAAVVLGAFFLLWQVRTFIGWFVIALFLAAVLNPAVNWLQSRHRLMKRPLAIGLTYLGVLVALLLVVGIFVPVLVDQINGFIKFVSTAANAPEGPTEYIKGLAKENGLGGLFQRFSDQLDELRKQLGGVLQNLLSSSGQIAISVAGMIAALATVLTLTFFLLLGGERYVSACAGLFPEPHRPLVRRLLSKSAGAISGYVTGNLAISVICGVTTFVVLLILGMPYAAPLALLVAVLDLIPLVGATLGGALLVVVGLFVEPWKAVVLLVYIVVYQQVEGSVLQPLVYSKAVQLNGLMVLVALLIGGQLLGIPGALLAIPVAEIIRILVTELLAYRRTAREAKEPAVATSSPPTKAE
ncbi:MAG: AI-2E family transporter [Actinomycetota bacterium]|nr:AI-2E family transporter [Actinomycetota bacterium]